MNPHQVLVYAGEYDFLCNWYGQKMWVDDVWKKNKEKETVGGKMLEPADTESESTEPTPFARPTGPFSDAPPSGPQSEASEESSNNPLIPPNPEALALEQNVELDKELELKAWRKYGLYGRRGNFSLVKVNNSGHMVPHDQPKAALSLLDDFLFGDYNDEGSDLEKATKGGEDVDLAAEEPIWT